MEAKMLIWFIDFIFPITIIILGYSYYFKKSQPPILKYSGLRTEFTMTSKKKWNYLLKAISVIVIGTFMLSGCSDNSELEVNQVSQNDANTEETKVGENNNSLEITTEASPESEEMEEKVVEADWGEYFNGINGAAVVYDASDGQYTIYNDELAETRRSPCSTFKIISSLISLENGIIVPDDSTHTWSGEVFWNEKWNHDIGFQEAFQTSCVWYFREVIDEIGKDMMQTELDKLQYGNCNISDWEGRLNTNNSNPDLTGFWIESSLKISPKEQVEVMERIFGGNTVYSEETRNELKQVMQVPGQSGADAAIYGKTGTGKDNGILVDAWFTGYTENKNGNIYFCVYLGRSDGMEVSSSIAKEIAVQIVSDYCGN